MKPKLITLAALIGFTQLASGGIGVVGIKGTFTTDSLYHRKTSLLKQLVAAGIADPGRTKTKATAKTNWDRGSRLQRVVAER